MSRSNAQALTPTSSSIPQGYKQTEVGVIPKDWDVQPLDKFVAYTNGKAHEQSISESGSFVVVNSKFISTDGITRKYSVHSFCLASTDDVLMVMSDVPNGRAIAKCYWVESDNIYTVNQRICLLHPRQIDGKLLYYLLDRHPFYLAFDDGAKQTNLRKADVLACPLGVPKSEPEQLAIATALSDVDALLGALDRLIAKKRDLKQAAMQQLLTGQTRLPGFKGEWAVKQLGELASLKNGYAFKSNTYTNLGAFKVVTIANVQDGFMTTEACNSIVSEPKDLQSHQRLSLGDILISMTGNVGRVCRVTEPNCLLNQRVGKLVPLSVNADLLFVLLCQLSFISAMVGAAKGGAQPNLSATDISGHRFNVPTDTREQTAIAEVLSDMDAEIAALEQRREKTRALKQGMMQELLTGRTRLVNGEGRVENGE